jgi:uncharacterized protein involved in cysteine biosynthesis
MPSIFLKSLRDILSPQVLGFILKISLGSFLLMVLFFWMFWESFSNFVGALVSAIPYIGSLGFIQSGSAFLASLIVAYGIIIAAISLLASLYSPKLLLNLAQKEYAVKGSDDSKISRSLYYNIKAGVIFLLLLILLLPLLFVPVVGQIVMLFLWALLIKEPTFYDVSSLFIKNEKEYMGEKSIWIVAIVASLFNYIPVLNLFAPIFAQIMFMHWLLPRLQKSAVK